jgi:hypothetical protein
MIQKNIPPLFGAARYLLKSEDFKSSSDVCSGFFEFLLLHPELL